MVNRGNFVFYYFEIMTVNWPILHSDSGPTPPS